LEKSTLYIERLNLRRELKPGTVWEKIPEARFAKTLGQIYEQVGINLQTLDLGYF